MKAATPFLIAGVPIAGLALQSWSAANAWTHPPANSIVVPRSSSSRPRAVGGSIGDPKSRPRRGMDTWRDGEMTMTTTIATITTTTATAAHSSPPPSSSADDGTTTTTTTTTAASGDDVIDDIDSLCLTPQLRMMTLAFASIPDERTRHKQLLHMASTLPDVDDDVRVSENRVPGCLSRVYVDCTATRRRRIGDGGDGGGYGDDDDDDDDGVWAVEYRGDSDGLLTKGLLALLIRGLNDRTPDEIDAIDPKFIKAARITQSLTPGRNNGFLNMLAVMKKKAREAVERANDEGGGGGRGGGEIDVEGAASATKNTMTTTTTTTTGGPMYGAILAALTKSLKPKSIELVDESHKHAGHAGIKGTGRALLYIVSDAFEGLNLVKRHKLIYALLGDVMPRIHALAIVARSTSEVE
ncbi:hypothetical protein ACHAXA_000502 [Cyclostephanos tholiformis]|uniref:Fe-S metabolism associated domain-containing protein n=1 Tax=Cyclostephanos tholiformis TaxID=382380 RepID=A0ABD3SSM8_9STRA